MLVILLFVVVFFIFAYFELSDHDSIEVEEDTFIRENAIRQLTEEEILLLQSYLDDENNFTAPYQKESSLISFDVTKIKGYIEKDFTDEIQYKYYYKMDNVQLFFPYNMDYAIMGFTSQDPEQHIDKTKNINTVEIVFTKSYGIVVKINSYDLIQAGLNLFVRKQKQRYDYWQTGKLKPICMSNLEKSNETLSQQITEASEKKPTFEILSRREKNQFENAIEDRSNSGKLMTFFFVLGVMSLLAVEHFQSIALVVFSIICFIFSLIASSKKRKLPTEYVNHIQAQIWRSGKDRSNLSIDTDFYVYYPSYWEIFLPDTSYIPIDMQVEVDTKQVLSFGKHLSISEEVKNYGAPKFFHHNVILAITGLILAILIFFFTKAGEKLDFTYQQLTSTATTWNIDDKENLKQSAIHSMDRVNLNLSSVSCDILNTQRIKPHHVQCNKIFVNLNPIDSNKLSDFPRLHRVEVFRQLIDDAKDKVLRLQNDENNISIQLTNSIQLYDENYEYSYGNEGFKALLDYYNGILSGNSANLKITGIVTNVSYHNGKISKLTLLTDYRNDSDKNQLFSFFSLILINNFVFLFVILITLINTILIIRKKEVNQSRLEKIISHYRDKIF